MNSDQPAGAAPPDALMSPRQMRHLKIAIVVMGALLLAGFATVIGRLVYLLNRPEVSTSAASAPAASHSTAGPIKDGRQLVLPPGAVIRHMALSGNRLAVHYEAPQGAGIAILDLGGTAPAQKVDLVTEPGHR